MQRWLKAGRIVLGWCWATSLAMVGLALWTEHEMARSAAMFALAGGLYVFLFFVADELCPKVPPTLSVFCKFFTGSINLGALAHLIWLWW